MCARAPTSSTARFSHFAQLGPVYLGGIVVRLHGATDGLASLLRDLGLQDVTTRQCLMIDHICSQEMQRRSLRT